MYMSYLKIFIHTVWGTKNRSPIISSLIKENILSHLKENAVLNNIRIIAINCYRDHVHCLITLDSKRSISQIMQSLKGESSKWINQNRLLTTKFEWAEDYFAASVSHYNIDKVINYINNQEEHHRKVSFHEEYESFISDLRL